MSHTASRGKSVTSWARRNQAHPAVWSAPHHARPAHPFIQGDGHGVCEVQAACLRENRNPQCTVRTFAQEPFRQASALGAEDEGIAGLEAAWV